MATKVLAFELRGGFSGLIWGFEAQTVGCLGFRVEGWRRGAGFREFRLFRLFRLRGLGFKGKTLDFLALLARI